MPRFNPNDHMMNLKGKDYLPVAPRLAWLNEELRAHAIPLQTESGSISVETQLEHYGQFTDSDKGGRERRGWEAVVAAHIVVRDTNDKVVLRSTAHKRQTSFDFADFVEKAETGAIGRALAAIGYGTIQSLDFEEGEKPSPIDGEVGPAVIDAPQASRSTTSAPKKPAVAAPQRQDPLSVLTGNPVPESGATAGTTPPALDKNERQAHLEWLKSNVARKEIADLLNEAIKKAKVPSVTALPDKLLQEVYEAAVAFSTN